MTTHKCRGPLMRYTAVVVIAALLAATTGARTASAALISTDQVAAQDSGAQARAKVVNFLQRDDVAAQLVRLGVDPGEAAARASALSPEELDLLATRIDDLPAGGSAVGAIVGAILLIFLILLLTDLLGWTDVFPFTKKGALAN